MARLEGDAHGGNATAAPAEGSTAAPVEGRGGAAGGATFGVAEALALASGAVRSAAPGLLWVQGEVDGLTRSRAGHWYWSLSGGGARLAVCALGRDAATIAATLAAAHVALADGLTVRVRGTPGVYSPRGNLQLRASAIDPAVCVGGAVLARREVRAALAAAGLTGRQAALRPVACPLRVAVVAPSGRGLEDFVAVLTASPWAWQVRLTAVPSEGNSAPAAIAAALRSAGSAGWAGWADLIVVTRGGGAGTTTAYDAFEVAAAVCVSAVPVIMAVGHFVDESVADEMAWATAATPTAAGVVCVELLAGAERCLLDAAGAIIACARVCLDHDEAELEAVESVIATRAATVAGQAAVDRWRRIARLAAVTAVVLAVLVVVLLILAH